jgi:hypothetical protein
MRRDTTGRTSGHMRAAAPHAPRPGAPMRIMHACRGPCSIHAARCMDHAPCTMQPAAPETHRQSAPPSRQHSQRAHHAHHLTSHAIYALAHTHTHICTHHMYAAHARMPRPSPCGMTNGDDGGPPLLQLECWSEDASSLPRPPVREEGKRAGRRTAGHALGPPCGVCAGGACGTRRYRMRERANSGPYLYANVGGKMAASISPTFWLNSGNQRVTSPLAYCS